MAFRLLQAPTFSRTSKSGRGKKNLTALRLRIFLAKPREEELKQRRHHIRVAVSHCNLWLEVV